MSSLALYVKDNHYFFNKLDTKLVCCLIIEMICEYLLIECNNTSH